MSKAMTGVGDFVMGTNAKIFNPTMTGGTETGQTHTNAKLTGTTTNTGTISGGTVSGAAVSGGTVSAAAISGGTIDNAVIGGTTPAAATFSSMVSSSTDISGVAMRNGPSNNLVFYDWAQGGNNVTVLTQCPKAAAGVVWLQAQIANGTVIYIPGVY